MNREKDIRAASGWLVLPFNIAWYLVVIFALYKIIAMLSMRQIAVAWGVGGLLITALTLVVNIAVSAGFFILQPNEAGVLLLFGKYVGTVKSEGFWWANPFYIKRKISLRLRNLNGEKLKVNDQAGNPIEIAAVVVWKVEDTFAACFDVDDFVQYVEVQSESALRHLATAYPYDSWEDESVVSLRANVDEVSEALEKELLERLHKAGVKVLEARLTHLAYAPEIAEAMLRRQQATAIIAARTKIVEGAVSMVRMALDHLKAENVIELDDERKAAMVSNLLVVLCGETNAQPVVNTGTLYG